ncbi:hypothetical protein DNTS_028787 [Danionella cerebrum]|uniref:Uncharacterized protein n=1 Tax=Danionella cerebrum TaxID=2873325 RepID=A0A553Q9Y1_9TELE|nr:hypothetical protein DNTS_028787 [Danionella translucida]
MPRCGVVSSTLHISSSGTMAHTTPFTQIDRSDKENEHSPAEKKHKRQFQNHMCWISSSVDGVKWVGEELGLEFGLWEKSSSNRWIEQRSRHGWCRIPELSVLYMKLRAVTIGLFDTRSAWIWDWKMSGRPRTTSFAESCKPVPQPSAFGSMKVSSKYHPELRKPCPGSGVLCASPVASTRAPGTTSRDPCAWPSGVTFG